MAWCCKCGNQNDDTTAPDYTDEISNKFDERSWVEEDSEKRVDNLKLVGYSPEVAHAIVENENNLLDEK